ncbi:hypothetical protein EI94DRAFT_1749891 [Lactarius quietus]|nr:hypothetical protein EI94DRAFT_1749891 [Lactarius quietus]
MGNCIYATIYSDLYHEVEQYRGPRGESDLHKSSSAPRRSTGERSARTAGSSTPLALFSSQTFASFSTSGTKFDLSLIYRLWEAFDINLAVGGTCGEIVTFKGKYCPTFVISQVAALVMFALVDPLSNEHDRRRNLASCLYFPPPAVTCG